MERQIPRISEVLYMALCSKLGTPTQVKIRRDMMDIHEMIDKAEAKCKSYRRMESGSTREGFRLKSSDIDLMFWHTNDIVICYLFQIPYYHPTQTVILMECDDTPPGFAKLQLLTPTLNFFIRQSCVTVNNRQYISSSLYKEVMQGALQSLPLTMLPATSHGPCLSTMVGGMEYDYAYCFSSIHWPLPAYHWIDRCQRQGWPSPQMLHDIISDGCHLVAISSGRSISPQKCEIEWRTSFSQAEYKLVYSMNHTQFLCYGLLKIFLNEVLNIEIENPLLCSYFMKTTLFWKVQENVIPVWCPQNILNCFWMCLQYLTRCVYRGEFPNFFIPHNNMFINKIHGVAQKQLFLQLLNLYNMGFSCLLLSPSLYQIFTTIIFKSQSSVRTDENSMLCEVELDIEFFRELQNTCMKSDKTLLILKSGIDIARHRKDVIDAFLRESSFSQFQKIFLKVLRSRLLIQITFYTLREDITENRSLDTLISATEFGFISEQLYVTLYLYNKERYMEALYHVERTKQKLIEPYVFHFDNTIVNGRRYMEDVGGQSLQDKVRKVVSFEIMLSQFCLIDELRQEVTNNQHNGGIFILVPPLVMTHMLLFLCHHHIGDRLRSRQSIDNLQALLHYDDTYINPYFRDISWQILGICKQINGETADALYCYNMSLKQLRTNCIHDASYVRIQTIMGTTKSLNC